MEKPLSVETDVIITVGGRESRVNSLALGHKRRRHFADQGCVKWLDKQLQLKEAIEATPTPAKRQRLSAVSDGSPGEASSSQASSNHLSAALRNRLQGKMSPTK